MPTQLIKTLLNHLPRHAEEEGDFYSVPRADLINALCSESTDRVIAENTVALLETLLNTLAVLNPAYLEKSEWCFVSFPAQLLAVSVLTALSEPDSRFFAPQFWNTQSVANDRKEQQRAVLKEIENRRVEFSTNARPIRRIYVAWSLIKLADQILFYQREDTQKRHDNKAGDYGLAGGRLNQRDMPLFANDKKRCLQLLQSDQAELIKPALPETLKRELKEEVGLRFGEHYDFSLWRSLKPYQQVQGAAPNHAFTEYHLAIFQIQLTLSGYLFLQQQLKTDERLVLFSLEEMAKGETRDGKIAYIKALFADFADDRVALKTALAEMPDSFVNAYQQAQDKYALAVPLSSEQPLKAGLLGKEKDLALEMNREQLSLLLGLAAYSRGFTFASVAEQVIFHPHNWVEVVPHSDLQRQLLELVKICKSSELFLETYQERLFRLSFAPDCLYFADELFHCSMKQQDLDGTKSKLFFTLMRKGFSTALGEIQAARQDFSISLELAHALIKVAAADWAIDSEFATKTRDKYKKALHESCVAMGLKGLLRQEAGRLVCRLKPELL